MEEIEKIRDQIRTLNSELREAKLRLLDAGLRKMGLQIGDRIVVDEEIVEVTGCDKSILLYGDPQPEGRFVKKDGTTGMNWVEGIGAGTWSKI